MDDLNNFCCTNRDCPKYGVHGEDNIRLRTWYGKNKDIRLLYCLVCKKRFSERRGTPLFDSRLPTRQVASIVEHLADGDGLRKTGRLTGTDYRTAGRYARIAGNHADQLHVGLAAHESLNIVHKRRATAKPAETSRTIIKPLSKAIENTGIALDKIDYMLGAAFEWEVEKIAHVKQDLTNAVEVLKKARVIVEEFYKAEGK